MRRPRFKFSVGSLMVVVAVCAAIVWLAPITGKYWWTWTVIRDVKRGQSQRVFGRRFF